MKILILHASAGEGHRRAAIAAESALKRSGVETNSINVIDALDFGSPFFKKSYVGFYFWFVKNLPAMWGIFYNILDHPYLYKIMYPIRRLYNAWHGRKLVKYVLEKKPDWIICTHFLSAEVLGHMKTSGKSVGHVTVLVTDYHPVRVWQHPGVDSYWVLSEEAKSTLIDRGVKPESVTVGGFPIMPEFQIAGNREILLRKYELDENRLTILLTTGSFGLGDQKKILEGLNSISDKVQCMVVCGRNEALKEALEKETYSYPVKIFGFVDFMSDLMDVSDMMVAKPGGATTAEAMAKEVPMIATGAIPGQETENLDFLLGKEAIFSADRPEEIVSIISEVAGNRGLLSDKLQACSLIRHPSAADDLAQERFKIGIKA